MAASEPYLYALAEEFMDGETQYPWEELSQMPLDNRTIQLEPKYGEPAVVVDIKFSRRSDRTIDVEVVAADAVDSSRHVVLRSNVAP